MKTLRWCIVALALSSACLQKSGVGIGLIPLDGAASEELSEPVLDTPPIAGPSERGDPSSEIPYTTCENGDETLRCAEALRVSRGTLCARTDVLLNPAITGSQTFVSSADPLTSNGVVDFVFWRRAANEADEPFPNDLDAPLMSDLKTKEDDVDPARPGVQLAANPDGTVSFRIVAGERTGTYEFRVVGDLATASSLLFIENCE